ncbi:unnamed protein product, partial [Phaeothamnion confervicola]
LRLELTAPVHPCKRREPPPGGDEEEWRLSAGERAVRKLGGYLEAGTALTIVVEVAAPLLPPPPAATAFMRGATGRLFGRAVYAFAYGDADVLRELMAAVDATNAAALNAAVDAKIGSGSSSGGSLRSHALSAADAAAADAGRLDIVCGFMIVDSAARLVVLEGLTDGGLARVVAAAPRRTANGGGYGVAYRVLYDPRRRFAARLYTRFGVDLKRVRLRRPLPELCRLPEVY